MESESVKKSKGKHHVTFKLADETEPKDENEASTKLTAVNAAKLKTTWVFWYDIHTDEKSLNEFLQKIHKVCDFSTFSDFWSAWKNVYHLCPLAMNSNIRMFKEGIEPIWEDPQHLNGGRFTISRPVSDPEEAIRSSLSFLLGAVVGEYAPYDQVTGAVVSVRPWGIMYNLWNKNSKSSSINETISKLKTHFGGDVFYQKNQTRIKKAEEQGRARSSSDPGFLLQSFLDVHPNVYSRRKSLGNESYPVTEVTDKKAGTVGQEDEKPAAESSADSLPIETAPVEERPLEDVLTPRTKVMAVENLINELQKRTAQPTAEVSDELHKLHSVPGVDHPNKGITFRTAMVGLVAATVAVTLYTI